jgi:hypothetical protein
MTPSAALIQSPVADFNTFLSLCQQALGYSVAESVDKSLIERSEPERFISCLAAMQDRNAKPGLAPHLLSHASFSVLVAADEETMLAILEVAEMPFVTTGTVLRGVQLAVISGTLAQWHTAVKLGSTNSCQPSVRAGFNRVMDVFKAAGLDVWKECASRALPDGTLLLEDKR